MGLISSTKFNSSQLADYTSDNTVAITRAATKTNYHEGIDTASGAASYEEVPTSGYQHKVAVADHADGYTEAIFAYDDIVYGKVASSRYLYYYDTSDSSPAWSRVDSYQFPASVFPFSMFRSANSGDIFVGTSSGYGLYKAATSTGNLAKSTYTNVLSFRTLHVGNTSTVGHFSFTERISDGVLWCSEWKSAGSGDAETDAIRVYKSTDHGDTWSEFFNYATDFADLFAANLGLHKIIYHSGSDNLYVATGDLTFVNGCYLSKSPANTRSWERILTSGNPRYTGDAIKDYTFIAPTQALEQDEDHILWFDDLGACGVWQHDTTDDSFELIPISVGIATRYFSVANINGTVYAAANNATAGGGAGIVKFPIAHPDQWVFLDFLQTAAPAKDSFQMIAGLVGGYVYCSFAADSASYSTVKYRHSPVLITHGIAVDPASDNEALDPFCNVGSTGWLSYAPIYHQSSGGYYNPTGGDAPCKLVGLTTYYNYVNDGTSHLIPVDCTAGAKPILISFWAKKTLNSVAEPTAASTLRFIIRSYDGGVLQSATEATINGSQWQRLSAAYWTRYTFAVDPTGWADGIDGILVNFCPPWNPAGSGIVYIDGVSVSQPTHTRPKLERLKAGAAADVVLTTLPTALPTAWSAIGKIVTRYGFDTTGTYCLWAAYNSDASKYIKLVVYNNQVMVIDQDTTVAAPLVTTVTGLPVQETTINTTTPYNKSYWGAFPPDTLMWALEYVNGSMQLSFSTQRSGVETVAGAIDVSADLTKLYDGCSQTTGEEIGGVVIYRAIFDTTIESVWDQNSVWPYWIKKSIDINIGISI